MNSHFIKAVSGLCFLLVFHNNALAQAVVTKEKPKDKEFAHGRELSLIGGPLTGSIRNDNIKSDEYALTGISVGANFGLHYFLSFSKYVCYSFGLEYNECKSTVYYKGFFRGPEKRVTGGAVYYPVSDANYKSTFFLRTIDIPICLRLKYNVTPNTELFLEGGVKLCPVLSFNLAQNGTNNKKGLYPNGNSYVLVEDVPALGFVNTTYNSNQSIEASKAVFSAIFMAGIKARTSEKTFFTFNFTYQQGVSDLYPNEKEYVNVLGDKTPHAKYTSLQMGIRVGAGYKIE